MANTENPSTAMSSSGYNQFPFLSLPRKARDMIYEELFQPPERPSKVWHEKSPEGQPVKPPRLTISPNTAILQTCRHISAEAGVIFRIANSFIRITITSKAVGEYIHQVMTSKRLPIRELKWKDVKEFKGMVASHELSCGTHDSFDTIVILHRDLEQFCRIVMEKVELQHKVKLIDSYPARTKGGHAILLSDHTKLGSSKENHKVQETVRSIHEQHTIHEKILAPYRNVLKAIPLFSINGAIDDNLKATTQAEITTPFAVNPEQILTQLEDKQAKAEAEYVKGESVTAAEQWCETIARMNRIEAARPLWGNLQMVGGPDFTTRMAKLRFISNLNRMAVLTERVQQTDQTDVIINLHARFDTVMEDAESITKKYPRSTFKPTTTHLARMYYQEAVVCRLANKHTRSLSDAQEYLDLAVAAITAACTFEPTAEILAEQERIKAVAEEAEWE